jgi:hypothetical protein
MEPASTGAHPPAQCGTGYPPCFCGAAVLQDAGARPLCYGSGIWHNWVSSSPAAQIWYHAEFEGISPGDLADLERMLQHTVDSQPPRHDGAATGWLQGVSYRLLAGRHAEKGFGLLAPRVHLVARGTKWATTHVEGLCPPVLHGPGHPPTPPPPIRLPEPEELPVGVRPMADQPVRMPYKPLQQQQALQPQSRAGLRWHGWCFYVFALPSIRCKPCCLPHSGPLKLLFLGSSPLPVISVCSSQLVPCTLLAIVCLGHIQQRPGSDLPLLRAGMLHWLALPGLPAVEIFEVTSRLVWTHQTTDDPCQLLSPRSSLCSPRSTHLTQSRHAHRRFVVQALRHSAATRELVDAAVATNIGCFGRLWRVPWENGYKEVFWRLTAYGVRASGAYQR